MIHDLWDVEAGFYFGRFETEDEAWTFVRDLIDANGEEYADALELGTPEDASGTMSRSGAALVEQARRPVRNA